MKCLICGKNYINLGVHIRRKHKVQLNDYRQEFHLLKTTPLVDESLSLHISNQAKIRLLDDDYKKELVVRCKENAKKNIGRQSYELSSLAKENLSKRNKENNLERLKKLSPKVKKILEEDKTLLAVRVKMGMGRDAVLKIVNLGLADYDKEIALQIGIKKRVKSRLNNKLFKQDL